MEENDIQDLQDSAVRTIRELTTQFTAQKEIMTQEAKQANVQMEEKIAACEATIVRLEQELAETKKETSKGQERKEPLGTNKDAGLDKSNGAEKEPDGPPARNTRGRKAQVLSDEVETVDDPTSKITNANDDVDAASVPPAAVKEATKKSESSTAKKVKLTSTPAVKGDFILEVYRLAASKQRLLKVSNKLCNANNVDNKEDLVEIVRSTMKAKRPKISIPKEPVFVFRGENLLLPARTELDAAEQSIEFFAQRWIGMAKELTRTIKPVIRFYVYAKGDDEWDGDDLVHADEF